MTVGTTLPLASIPKAALKALTPEAQAVAEEAESVTGSGTKSDEPGWPERFSTAYVFTCPTTGSRSMLSRPAGP